MTDKMDFSPDALKKHFHALSKKRIAADAKLDPLRIELNALVAGEGKFASMPLGKAQDREKELRTEIAKRQGALYPIERERAAVARALGGQTGLPDGMTFGHSLSNG